MKSLHFLVALMAVTIASRVGESKELNKRFYQILGGKESRPEYDPIEAGGAPSFEGETAGRSAGGRRALGARYISRIPVSYVPKAPSAANAPNLAYVIFPQAEKQEQEGYRY